MTWKVEFHPELAAEFSAFSEAVQDALLAHVIPLREFGPTLGRPLVDTLKGAKLASLKELRFSADGGVWRVAFSFDGDRIAVLLAAGDKQGVNEQRFYTALMRLAVRRFESWEQHQ